MNILFSLKFLSDFFKMIFVKKWEGGEEMQPKIMLFLGKFPFGESNFSSQNVFALKDFDSL